jgi:uroporphyrin-III C-methyltransferase
VAHVTVAVAGRVYLVGAGPGDPELLTRKAADLLATADIVLHDDLVPQAVLALAGSQALVVSVGKRCGAKHATQSETNALMVVAARSGQSVVRLKSGDPLVFGRAAEEMDALEASGVEYEVVPGITAAFAAAAALKSSLTDRRSASSILLSTGHRAEGQGLRAGEEENQPTRVVYMPGRSFAALAAEWLGSGEDPRLPCVVISRVAQPDQAIERTTLGELATLAPPPAPALLLAGWALVDRAQHDFRNAPQSISDASSRAYEEVTL